MHLPLFTGFKKSCEPIGLPLHHAGHINFLQEHVFSEFSSSCSHHQLGPSSRHSLVISSTTSLTMLCPLQSLIGIDFFSSQLQDDTLNRDIRFHRQLLLLHGLRENIGRVGIRAHHSDRRSLTLRHHCRDYPHMCFVSRRRSPSPSGPKLRCKNLRETDNPSVSSRSHTNAPSTFQCIADPPFDELKTRATLTPLEQKTLTSTPATVQATNWEAIGDVQTDLT